MTLSDRIFNATTANGCRELTEERFKQGLNEVAWEAVKKFTRYDEGDNSYKQRTEKDFNQWFNKQVV